MLLLTAMSFLWLKILYKYDYLALHSQENYERMKVLVDQLRNRTEKIKLGEYQEEHTLW